MIGGRTRLKQVDVVVPAAGRGSRMQCNGNKMFLPLKGVPIIYRTIRRLATIQAVNRLILVIRKEEQQEFEEIFRKFGKIEKKWIFIEGGDERHVSVRNGLRYVLENRESETVMTHDGARPFLMEEMLDRMIDNMKRGAIVVPVQKIAETVRLTDENGKTGVIDRNRLFATQTPQLFSVDDIESCFLDAKQADLKMTDEAGYFESKGLTVTFVEGDWRNIKITTRTDIAWAEFILEREGKMKLEGIDDGD